MNYIENIYICLAAPFMIAVLCTRGSRRRIILFLLGGMTVCLLSSYINSFLASVHGADELTASMEIAPCVEELMKLLPVLFFFLVFEPGKKEAAGSVQMTAVGFATFENACYLTQNGAAQILHLLIRGFGTGAMHVVCGVIVATGLLYLWDRLWLRVAGMAGILSLAITYHATYNLLISQEGTAALIACFIPVLTTFLYMIFRNSVARKWMSD